MKDHLPLLNLFEYNQQKALTEKTFFQTFSLTENSEKEMPFCLYVLLNHKRKYIHLQLDCSRSFARSLEKKHVCGDSLTAFMRAFIKAYQEWETFSKILAFTEEKILSADGFEDQVRAETIYVDDFLKHSRFLLESAIEKAFFIQNSAWDFDFILYDLATPASNPPFRRLEFVLDSQSFAFRVYFFWTFSQV